MYSGSFWDLSSQVFPPHGPFLATPPRGKHATYYFIQNQVIFRFQAYHPRLCGNLDPHSPKMVFGTSIPEFNCEKVHLFVAKLSSGRDDSINSDEKESYLWILGIPNPQNQETSMLSRLMVPGYHWSVVGSQREGGGHMHIPPPGMVRNPIAHFEQKIG